jgi:CheY-like chemotaxis protein
MSPSVLIVDDDRDTRDLYSYVLREAGLETVALGSGGEALQYLESHPEVRLVLLDLAMPVLDGLTVAKEIRRNESLHPDRPPRMIAFLTGHNVHDVDRWVAEREGVLRPFLQKDGDVEHVAEEVTKWVNGCTA